MNIFTTYIEAKEALIAKMPWSDDQKKEIQELVNKYPQKASLIDWNKKDLSAEQAFSVLKEESKKAVKKQIRQGVPGLKQNDDYIEIPESKFPAEAKGRDIRVFIPMNHKASCALGREAKWCTAMEKEPGHWNSYTKKGKVFFYIHNDTADNPDMKKIAVVYDGSNNIQSFTSAWNIKDLQIRQITVQEQTGLTDEFFKKYTQNVHETIIKKANERYAKVLKNIRHIWNDESVTIFSPENREQFEVLMEDGEWIFDFDIPPLVILTKSNGQKYGLDVDRGVWYEMEGNSPDSTVDEVLKNNSPAQVFLFQYILHKHGNDLKKKLEYVSPKDKQKNIKSNFTVKVDSHYDSVTIHTYIDSFMDYFNLGEKHFNEWIKGMINGDEFFDPGGSYHMSASDIESSINKQNMDTIRKIMSDPDHNDALSTDIDDLDDGELLDLIMDNDVDDIIDALRTAQYTGENTGALDEFYKSVYSAIEDTPFRHQKSGGFTATFKPSDGIMPILMMLWNGFEGLFITEEDNGVSEPLYKMDVSEPQYGWSGFSDEAFNERLAEELPEPKTKAQKMKEEGQKDLFDDQGKPTKEAKRHPKPKKKKRLATNEDYTYNNIFDKYRGIL